MNSIVNLHHSLFLPTNFPIVLPCGLNNCLIHLDTCIYLVGKVSLFGRLNCVLIMMSYDTYREIFKQLPWKFK